MPPGRVVTERFRMSVGPKVEGHGKARLLPERRTRLRRLVASVGLNGAARSLGIGVATLERAADPYALLSESAINRLDAAIDRLCPLPPGPPPGPAALSPSVDDAAPSLVLLVGP